ncbi:MAG: hypothetical protein AUG45_09105 [Ktedonobacter sp. 13_1_20CM_3_54_15]|nr:MAG: hypothetical protein AUG45_09105 [Ktedonobacter sp. 13_1_20CM_3_54_15]
MRNLNRIVIIGTGAAGLTTAESLRRLGFGGKIMMVHAENTRASHATGRGDAWASGTHKYVR